MSPVHVTLDIDGLLGCSSVSSSAFYAEKGAVLSAIKTHYVFPGVIEFIQLLYATKDVEKVSFFSAGSKERNKLFVGELLKKALSEQKWHQLEKEIVILSKDDLVSNSEQNFKIQHDNFGLNWGNMKKDLTKIEKSLHNVVLIDDDSSYIHLGQEKNVLKAPEAKDYDFFSSDWYLDECDEEGYRKISCNLSPKEDLIKAEIIGGNEITIVKEKDSYTICFLTQSNRYEELPIDLEKNSQLIESFEKLYREEGLEIEDQNLLEKIYELVNSNQGKTKRFCREINRICYVAGLLFKTIEQAKKEKVAITEILFQLQYKKSKEKHKPVFEKLSFRDDLYLYGIEKLREVNKNFLPMTPKDYSSYLSETLA